MRAVLVPVARIIDRGVIVVEVPAVHVVYVAVLIIVNLVAISPGFTDVVFLRSGWLVVSPVSITATMVLALSVVTPQASGESMSASDAPLVCPVLFNPCSFG